MAAELGLEYEEEKTGESKGVIDNQSASESVNAADESVEAEDVIAKESL